MLFYVKRGELPQQKHTTFYNSATQSLYREQLVTTKGFSDNYSTKYHINMPTKVLGYETLQPSSDPEWRDAELACRHFKTDSIKRPGNFLSARVLYLFNRDVSIYTAALSENTDLFYKNAFAHELIFCHHGSGTFRSDYGLLDITEGDYLIVPKGTIYQMRFDDPQKVKLFIVETLTPMQVPLKYRNSHGQLLEYAPYSERDFNVPQFMEPIEKNEPVQILVKAKDRLYNYTYDHHPFNVVGWDGYLYPFTFNIKNYLPVVGKVHQPPPSHTLFSTQNLEIYNFTPRLYDFHPNAIPAPYYHSNVDCDEVIYYVSGNFMSRKGIKEGSITLHPMGIPHGPQPGKTESSIGKQKTDEYAVMVDTFAPLQLTQCVKETEDDAYYRSWIEPAS